MKPKVQKMIDEIMYETNYKINAIVNEIRDIRFSALDEKEKMKKCDHLREEFERVMMEEEKKIEEVINKNHENK